MGASRRIRGALLIVELCLAGASLAQTTGKTVRHYKVAEQDSVPPELTEAEAAIEKKDYATAEPLLKKVVAADPVNYQAWFDLGFVYNGLGNTQESIAAYRKSVAAKPDVFESNLNLGLMLAKTGQPDAEQFLRAATKLKPTANQDEGRTRAWVSLAHVVESSKPEEAIQAYKQAATLDPKDPEPHLSAGPLLEKENRFADAEQEYKEALAIDPASSDALTGLANIYMRGHRLADAEGILRQLVALHPSDSNAHMQLGRTLAAIGKNDDAIGELQAAMPPDGILVADGGFAAHWTGLLYDTQRSGRTYIADRGLACDHFGNDKRRSPLLDDAAERQIGDARHRCEDHRIVKRDGTNRNAHRMFNYRVCLDFRQHDTANIFALQHKQHKTTHCAFFGR